MGFWELLEVSSMPVLQVMLVGLVGAFLASGYSNALHADARKHMNRVVFLAFTPSLMFASLAKTVTLKDIISWWFMLVNIGLIFLIGGTLGWVVVKLLRPERHLEGLVVATCAAGNLGNLMLIVIPAICNEERSPFGEPVVCRNRALSYASFSMALGGFYIWTYAYSLMRNSGMLYEQMKLAAAHKAVLAASKGTVDDISDGIDEKDMEAPLLSSTSLINISDDYDGAAITEQKLILTTHSFSSGKLITDGKLNFLGRAREYIVQLAEELITPPTIAAILGFIFGATLWLKSLIIGAAAPLRVVQDSIQLMGDGTIPCITLILGGNLTQGIRKSKLKFSVILAVLFLKYTIIPASGLAVIKAAGKLGFLAEDPLYRYTLLLQYTLPPAMNIGTMAELFDVAREECSVLFLWNYLVCALALTIWSTVYMWFVS